MKVKVFNARAELVSIETERVVKTDAEWRELLTRTQYLIARNKGTEPPFCGNLLDNKQQGVYCCICCGLPLFSSSGKFNSERESQPLAIASTLDSPSGMSRSSISLA